MDIECLGWRTELALLAAAGSTVTDHGEVVEVATPAVPDFYWGNFLLVRPERVAEPVAAWERRMAEAFPGSRHRSLGVDGTVPAGVVAPWLAAGFEAELCVVQLREAPAPDVPKVDAEVRPLLSDQDWREQELLTVAGEDAASYTPSFVTGRVAGERRLVRSGRGTWWGAFDGEHLLASLGVFRAGAGLARYQSVKTHPDARRRGLARALVLTAAAEATGWGARRLVIVADPDHHAAALYRTCGFVDHQTYLQLGRAPGPS